ncbi:DUF1506 family protein [Borrelia miyamotoi]|uniref:DUF1506 domain-containing protein n=2 Tax=Borrelia miyamotoi TaxID=47466 RepID=A0A481YHY4_9SPIR|nr:DUF1506 family protein [Borrelia miyamotoi]QBK62584.1 DUF1506 domain-containing protein [Borrelia miyamotoi]QBK63879.1 DUF1506 domain-containing protein [Borrelia miyamotoi]QBK65190.1 DUF1506 domain-containing protein [Borrelia miyamotoi]QBK66437.1 DUF1506 domain-containing protein [Borrelia miyamotoi]QBL99329.1 DUF1506 domain-containing protein [Borrelia miyamotoi]
MNLRNRLSSMAIRMIDKFLQDSLLKFYKGTHFRNEEFASIEIIFTKANYIEFVGIIIDITPSELTLIEDSNLFEQGHLSKLYTYENLEFNLKCRVSLGDKYFEIIKIDSSIGYMALILRSIVWK